LSPCAADAYTARQNKKRRNSKTGRVSDAETAKGRAMTAFVRGVALLGGLVLVGLMLFTSLDVTLRAGFNLPIYGAQEIVELGMVLVATLGMAHAGWAGVHISIDFAESFFGPQVLRAIDTLLHVLGVAVLGTVAWFSLEEGLDALGRSAATNVLQIPQAPFHAVVAFGLGLYAVDLAVQAARTRRGSRAAGACE
jgi:TRAP-type C4-dicarboxylate transport system permease small subunit